MATFGTMHRTHRWLRRLAALTLVGAMLLAGLVLESRREIATVKLATLDLASDKLDGALRVLQITDTHDQDAARWQQVVAHARETRPDLIALTGDVVNTFTSDYGRLDAFMAELAALQIPTYYVQGNHDHWEGHLPAVTATLEKHGVTVLANNHATLDGAWGNLDVVGTTDYYDSDASLPDAMAGTRPNAFQLVLTHDPGIVDDLAASGAELAICGHTHGGQVRLPLIGALYAPGQGFLPDYDKGLFTVGNSRLYIDSGAGQTAPLRFLDPAQVTLITLHP